MVTIPVPARLSLTEVRALAPTLPGRWAITLAYDVGTATTPLLRMAGRYEHTPGTPPVTRTHLWLDEAGTNRLTVTRALVRQAGVARLLPKLLDLIEEVTGGLSDETVAGLTIALARYQRTLDAYASDDMRMTRLEDTAKNLQRATRELGPVFTAPVHEDDAPDAPRLYHVTVAATDGILREVQRRRERTQEGRKHAAATLAAALSAAGVRPRPDPQPDESANRP